MSGLWHDLVVLLLLRGKFGFQFCVVVILVFLRLTHFIVHEMIVFSVGFMWRSYVQVGLGLWIDLGRWWAFHVAFDLWIGC